MWSLGQAPTKRSCASQGQRSSAHAYSVLRPHHTPRKGCSQRMRATALRVCCTAAVEAAEASKKRRGRPAGSKKKDPDISESGMQDLPVPTDHQQTLKTSFTMGGVGLHTGEYAVIRVRPAYAGEGRYFVRVPKGTNESRFKLWGEPEEVPEGVLLAADPPPDPELEKAKVSLYLQYLRSQEEDNYPGTFEQWVFDLVEWEVPYQREAIAGVNEAQAFPPEDEEDEGEDEGEEEEVEGIEAVDESDPSLMRAHASNVKLVGMPYMQLGDEGQEGRVLGVELLLAALETCGVDNARIEMEGGHEVPVLDNSALGWCFEVQQSGLRPAPLHPRDEEEGEEEALYASRPAYKPIKPLLVQSGDAYVSLVPGDFAKLTAGVDHQDEAPVIGQQWYSWRYTQDLHFRYEVAPARGYAASAQELFTLRADGFVKAGAENLFVIGHGERWYDPEMVRFYNDEPCRRKVVELAGALALLAPPGGMGIPTGHTLAFQADHGLLAEFLRVLLEELEGQEGQGLTSTEAILDRQQEILEEGYETLMEKHPEAREALGSRGFD